MIIYKATNLITNDKFSKKGKRNDYKTQFNRIWL